jgi:8-oxo-dGTP diphosphatase
MSFKDIKRKHAKQNIKLAVDNCIFTVKDGKLQVLLIKMKQKFVGSWALPGGLILNKESIDHAAKRILNEETGVGNVYLEQLYTFGKPERDPFNHVVSVSYFALIPSVNIRLQTTDKYADVDWFEFARLPKLAYDHDEIVRYAKQRLAWKISYTNAVWSLLPDKFSLTELQKVYEAILGRTLDKRNFRRKILSLNLIKEVGEKSASNAHRPASLFSFISKKQKIVEIL